MPVSVTVVRAGFKPAPTMYTGPSSLSEVTSVSDRDPGMPSLSVMLAERSRLAPAVSSMWNLDMLLSEEGPLSSHPAMNLR